MSDDTTTPVTTEVETPAAEVSDQVETQEAEAESPETEAEATPDAERKRKSGWQRTQEELRRQRDRTDRLERMLEAALDGRRSQAQPTEQPPPAEPTRDQFKNDDEFVNAVIQFRVEQKAKEVVSLTAQAAVAQQEAAAAAAAFSSRVEVFRKEVDDFDDIIELAPPIPNDVALAIQSDDAGPRIAYALAKDHDLIRRLHKMPPAQRLMTIGKLAASVTAEKPKVTKAPPPLKTVPVSSGSSSMDGKSPDEIRKYLKSQNISLRS